jgi:hypothetical protein
MHIVPISQNTIVLISAINRSFVVSYLNFLYQIKNSD